MHDLDFPLVTPEQRARAEAVDRAFRARTVVPARRRQNDPGWRWVCIHPPADAPDGVLMYQAFSLETGELATRPMSGQEAARLLHSQGFDTWSISVRLRSAELDLNTLGIRDGTGRLREAHAIRRNVHNQTHRVDTNAEGETP